MPNEEKIKVDTETEEVENKRKNKKDKVEELKEEIDKLKADVEHWKNEYYRAYADTKNLRSSLEKDHQNAIKYRAEGFIDSLLPVLDSFHMALGNEPETQELKNYLIGFQFIYKNLVSALENEGVSEIAPQVGQDFDSVTMNAVDTVENDGPANKIMKVYGKGYKLHDRLVRPAMVSVSKEKTEPKNEEKTDA